MHRLQKTLPGAVLATLLVLSACQAPERRPRSSLSLKTIHPHTGHCGHFPWRERPAEDRTQPAPETPAEPRAAEE